MTSYPNKFYIPGGVHEGDLDFTPDVLYTFDRVILRDEFDGKRIVRVYPEDHLFVPTPIVRGWMFAKHVQIGIEFYRIPDEALIIDAPISGNIALQQLCEHGVADRLIGRDSSNGQEYRCEA
jgi:hypothetical protein